MKKINLVDTTMRDGSHAISHSFTPDQISQIAAALDKSGVSMIELSHGDGIAGSSINYGQMKCNEMQLLRAASAQIKNAKLAVLLLPGIGTIRDLEEAFDNGATAVRVATHVTEADISIQHIQYAKKAGKFACGFLMMSHMAEPDKILEQAKIMVDSGADYINMADSAGYLTPDGVRRRVAILRENLDVPIGFHAHNNLGLAVANSLAAIQEGATYIDGTCCGLGAGSGNNQIEVFNALALREGYDTGCELYSLLDAAEVVRPVMVRPQIITSTSVLLGYAGVYSSFLLHARRAAERFQLDPRDIMLEIGRRKLVGGQEDMIIDIAYNMAQRKRGIA